MQNSIRVPATSTASTLLSWCSTALDRAVDTLSDAARVTRFLRGRLEFTPRADDIFIVSYPRSGTTWMQFLAYLLTSDGSMGFRHISQVAPWWERSLAWGNASAADFDRLGSPRIFKSHLPYQWLPRGARYIYMTRNGTDVAVSYYHLYRSHLGFQGSFAVFFERFMRGDLQYGSWFEHLAGWEQQRGNPRVMFLAYEDLKRAPEACVRDLIAFLELSVSEDKVADVLDKGSFAFMKAHEDKFDHIGELRLQRDLAPGSFIRRGNVGDGAEYFTPTQRARFERVLRARGGAADDADRPPWHPTRQPAREWRLAAFLH